MIFRSSTMSQSFASSRSSNDSRHLLNSHVINDRMAAQSLMTSQTQTMSRQESIASQTHSLASLDQCTMTAEPFNECVTPLSTGNGR